MTQPTQHACLPSVSHNPLAGPTPNAAQTQAIATISAHFGEFVSFVLAGITGSGKTEVYLHLAKQVLQKNRQVLILVPEISLTPQLIDRFLQRLGTAIAVFHSGLNDNERLRSWLSARAGQAKVIIGTRSAVFLPLPEIELIIVDEEHDSSYKQQDGLRYHGRDLAVKRAASANIPIVLGSATPSMESQHNLRIRQYRRLDLPYRAGTAQSPTIHLIDLRRQSMTNGLSSRLLQMIETHLQDNGQVLICINRRGYAPAVICQHCGTVIDCPHCDAHMIFHTTDNQLHCHHCGARRQLPNRCDACGHTDLDKIGAGTQRIEAFLRERFPKAGVLRIDRDSTRRRGALVQYLEQIRAGQARLLVGTQMLAKGHDFPDLTLAAVVNLDQGLLTADFRGPERTAQLLVQVAGRAGRSSRRGEVAIQTYQPNHPLLTTLLNKGYQSFAEVLLKERQIAKLPPTVAIAVLRAEAKQATKVNDFLTTVVDQWQHRIDGVHVIGPVPTLLQRRDGYHRAQILCLAERRRALHDLLDLAVAGVRADAARNGIRLQLDVDPQEVV